MKILHVAAGLSCAAGGLAVAVSSFAKEMSKNGHTVTLATIADNTEQLADAVEQAQMAGCRVIRFTPTRPHCLFFSWDMFRRLPVLIKQTDIVHVHSNWTFPVWWSCFLAWRYNKPLVMSPHGALDPVRLAYSAWKKKMVGWIDRFFLCRAAVIHATSEMEKEWIKQFVGGKSRKQVVVAVVPNGVDVNEGSENLQYTVSKVKDPPNEICKLERKGEKRSSKERVVLYLGRNHPLKGVDLLNVAWTKVRRSGWRLDLVGPGFPSGVVDGAKKWSVLKSADIFVLPTRSEGFPLVVLEALAAGVPVITTKGAPWSELLGNSDSSKGLKCKSSKVGREGAEVLKCEDSTVLKCEDCEELKCRNPEVEVGGMEPNDFRTPEL